MPGTLPIAYELDEPDGETTNLSTLPLADALESSSNAVPSDDRTTTIDPAPPVHHDEPPGTSPWWSRLGAWLGALFRLRRAPLALPPLPPPARPGTLVSQASEVSASLVDEMFHWLWRLDGERLESIEALASHVRAARSDGPRAFLEAHVRFVVAREHPGRDGAIRISRLRDKLIGYRREDVDQVLAQLAAEGLFELVAADPASGGRPRDPAFYDAAGDRFDCVCVRKA